MGLDRLITSVLSVWLQVSERTFGKIFDVFSRVARLMLRVDKRKRWNARVIHWCLHRNFGLFIIMYCIYTCVCFHWRCHFRMTVLKPPRNLLETSQMTFGRRNVFGLEESKIEDRKKFAVILTTPRRCFLLLLLLF